MLSNLVAGVSIGGATGVAIVIAEIAITGSTRVPLESAVAVGVAVCLAALWIGRKLQRIEDTLKIHSRFFNNIRCLKGAQCPIEEGDEDE